MALSTRTSSSAQPLLRKEPDWGNSLCYISKPVGWCPFGRGLDIYSKCITIRETVRILSCNCVSQNAVLMLIWQKTVTVMLENLQRSLLLLRKRKKDVVNKVNISCTYMHFEKRTLHVQPKHTMEFSVLIRKGLWVTFSL